MNREDRNELYRMAKELWGRDAQREMVYEEIGEFMNEFASFKRGRGDLYKMAEEIADLRIMLEQVEVMYGLQDHVAGVIDKKLDRLNDRVLEEAGKKHALFDGYTGDRG